LWLFTESNFTTFVIPDTVFGIFGALAGPLLTSNASPDLLAILSRLPQVLLYNWSNLLIFDLANQRHPDAVVEDALNKPWRPLVTGRITATQTRRLLLASLPIVLAINWYLGVWKETALLFSLTWMYNDLRGGDDDFILRNLIIGFAFGLYNGGALRIACGLDHTITNYGYYWVVLISGVIFTTIHVQDMKDQTGDQSRGRRSAPLVLGDYAARWTVAVPVILWSTACPFLDLGPLGYIIACGVGSIIVGRLFGLRSVQADHRTWQLWTAWTAFLYLLPLIKSPGVFASFSGVNVEWL
jgi:4-hydroxybenzoate polyprenyltransferase